jgi:hypothetical protein
MSNIVKLQLPLADFLDACEKEGIKNFTMVLDRAGNGSERMQALPGVTGRVLRQNSDGNAVVSVTVKAVRKYLLKLQEQYGEDPCTVVSGNDKSVDSQGTKG